MRDFDPDGTTPQELTAALVDGEGRSLLQEAFWDATFGTARRAGADRVMVHVPDFFFPLTELDARSREFMSDMDWFGGKDKPRAMPDNDWACRFIDTRRACRDLGIVMTPAVERKRPRVLLPDVLNGLHAVHHVAHAVLHASMQSQRGSVTCVVAGERVVVQADRDGYGRLSALFRQAAERAEPADPYIVDHSPNATFATGLGLPDLAR